MLTPAQHHRLKKTAAQEAAKASADNPLRHATGHELMLAKLHADKRRLKAVQSIERKAEVKREILPDYAPYVAGVLSAGKGGPDEVLMSIMVWAIDAGEEWYGMALDIAGYALQHRLPMPDQYQRTTGCLLAEEFADYALTAIVAKQPVSLPYLQRAAELTQGEDMPDEVRAKLEKSLGLALLKDEGDGADPPAPLMRAALARFHRAHELNPKKSGVKKNIEVLERKLKG